MLGQFLPRLPFRPPPFLGAAAARPIRIQPFEVWRSFQTSPMEACAQNPPSPHLPSMYGARRGPWLGQVPLVLGPSSWGAGAIPPAQRGYDPVGVPPYWGGWGVVGEGGKILECGKVGPFDTIDEAFGAAADAAAEHGATALPGDGWAQVEDSRGRTVGPIT